MKFVNTLVPFSLLALAAAQGTTTTAPTTVSLSPQASCAANCASRDTCCTAVCFKVPCPNQSMANDTNSCVAACPQGSGTPSDASAYASCEQACFTSHFFPATQTAGAGAGTTTAATTTGSSSGSSSTGLPKASGSGSSTASSTSSSSSSAKTGAANRVELAVSGAGLLAVLVAALAL